MRNRIVALGLIALAAGAMALASACASLAEPNNPTTQSLGSFSEAASAIAPVVAAIVPVPWGQIAAGVLGAVGVIAGIIAHSVTSRASAQQVVGAVTTGLQAASQTLGSATVNQQN